MHSLRICSPAARPLDDDDLLCEILLRLPPLPSSLPRAALVCKRWRSLASGPGFSTRFRIRHRRSPALLGFFGSHLTYPFLPTLEAPNRVPPGRFSLEPDEGERHGFRFRLLGCRHGLVLLSDQTHPRYLVWDPITGDQHRIADPQGLHANADEVNGAVLRAAQHFRVVLVAVAPDDNYKQQCRAFACVYSSETGEWGNAISTPIALSEDPRFRPRRVNSVPAVLAGGSLYWILTWKPSFDWGYGAERHILEFDLERQKVAVIWMPRAMVDVYDKYRLTVVREDGGGLGLLVVLCDFTAQLWKREADSDGFASWGLERTIDLNKILSLNLEQHRMMRLRFAEDTNLLVLCTVLGLFMIQLLSLQSTKLAEDAYVILHPFESVYTLETPIGGGHGAPDLVQNT